MDESHAQPEIVEPSKKIFELIRPIVPFACEAFVDYRLNSVTLSGPELEALKTGDSSGLSAGELREFTSKKRSLGFESSKV